MTKLSVKHTWGFEEVHIQFESLIWDQEKLLFLSNIT